MAERTEKAKIEREERAVRALARWDPFEELDLLPVWSAFRERGSLRERLARLLGEPMGAAGRAHFAPSVDIAESDERYVVTAELPGAKREDITVELKDQILTIHGEKRHEREEKKEHGHWLERSYGSFHRSFTLPANADVDHAKAEFAAGVLTIEVPKTEAAKPRVISIR